VNVSDLDFSSGASHLRGLKSRAIATAFWTLGILSLVYELGRAVSSDPYQGYDIVPAWKSVHAFVGGGAVYTASGAGDFLYPPSALLLLIPLAAFGLAAAKGIVLILDLASILVAAAVCLRLFGLRWQGAAGAVTLFGLSLSWPVFSTLHTENVNGFLLLGEAVFLLAAARGRWMVAGTVLGLTLALKPVLAPLILILAFYRRWRALFTAIAIPGVLSAIVLLAAPATRSFFGRTMPLLIHGQNDQVQAVSISLRSVAERLSVPSAVAIAVQVGVLVGAAFIFWRRRCSSEAEPRRLVELSAIALIAAFLLSTFAFRHYGIYLLPLVISVADPSSQLRYWITWVGFYGLASMDFWNFDRVPSNVNDLLAERVTLGLVVLLVALWLGVRREEAATGEPPRSALNATAESHIAIGASQRGGVRR
jgi:arabinofuranan 3-O-arabinosyltransferase